LVRAKEILASAAGPKNFIMTVNAGIMPNDHWVLDPEAGGGRLLSEGCHYLDLMRYLSGSPITCVGRAKDPGSSVTLQFADGSSGVLHYLTNGHKSYPKEKLQIFCEGRILELNNFRKLTGYGWPRFRSFSSWRQNKGQNESVRAFIDAVTHDRPSPIPAEELFEVTRATLYAASL
jgi:predicted dehydrogenase